MKRTNDVGVRLHVTVLLCELKSFVVASRHDEKLDGRTEVVELLEESAKKDLSSFIVHCDFRTTGART